MGAIAALFIGYQAYTYLRGNFFTPSGETVYIHIHEHATFDDVVQQIEKKTKPRDINSFIRLAKTEGYPDKIHTGRYAITNGMTNHKLLSNLKRHIQAPVSLKFNNIRTKAQLAGRLSKQLMADSLTLLSILNDSLADEKLGFKPETVVAMFIPNTYDMLWDITPALLMKRMHHEYEEFWTDERKQKAKKANLTPVQVTTLASIIEEETNHKADSRLLPGCT